MSTNDRGGAGGQHPNAAATTARPADQQAPEPSQGNPDSPHTCHTAPDWTPGLRRGDDDENDRLQAECPACRAADELAARIARWEDEPLDPEDDLALIADYPSEVERLRAEQGRIRRNVVYQVVHRIGGETRRRFLEVTSVGGFHPDAAEEFYADHVCRCKNLGDDARDDFVPYQRHHEANRCGPCLVRSGLEEARYAALRAEVRCHAPRRGTARRLAEILNGEPA